MEAPNGWRVGGERRAAAFHPSVVRFVRRFLLCKTRCLKKDDGCVVWLLCSKATMSRCPSAWVRLVRFKGTLFPLFDVYPSDQEPQEEKDF